MADTTDLDFEVWYLTPHGSVQSFDREFGQSFKWDMDLHGGFRNRVMDVDPNWDMAKFWGVRSTHSWESLLLQANVTHLWIEGWRFAEYWKAVYAARKLGIKIWLRGETNDLAPRSGVRALLRRIALKYLFSRVSHFFYIGSANRRFYESFGIGASQLSPTPYCIDNDWFSAKAEGALVRRKSIRERWSVPEDAFCILFCGKFIAKKRPLDLVRAAAQIKGRKVHLLFVGSGALRNDIEAAYSEATNAANAPDHFELTFSGFLNQSEIVDAYVAADCLALPSDSGETWGLVANEAMACGTPVVASNLCGCAEDLVATAGMDMVFACGDVAGLAKSIMSIRHGSPSKGAIAERVAAHHFDATISSVVRQFERGQ